MVDLIILIVALLVIWSMMIAAKKADDELDRMYEEGNKNESSNKENNGKDRSNC
jgi:hypothetical protein